MRLTSLATRLLGSTSALLSLGPALAFSAPQKAPMAAPVSRARRDSREGVWSDCDGALRSDGCWTWLKVAPPCRCSRACRVGPPLSGARSRLAHLTGRMGRRAGILGRRARFPFGGRSALDTPTSSSGSGRGVAGSGLPGGTMPPSCGEASMSLLIRNGRIVTASDDYVADLYCEDQTISRIESK